MPRRFHEAVLQVIVPPAGARLFVITVEAVTSRPRSSPILIGWWSVQCNDFTKMLIASGRARQHRQHCKRLHKERGHRSGSGDFSKYSGGLSPILMNGDARCGSKPARWRCIAIFTKECMRHEIPEEPVRRDSTLLPPSASVGPLEIWMHRPPHEMRTPTKYTKKLAAFQTLANCHGPYGAV
jgi:hypothetical protein